MGKRYLTFSLAIGLSLFHIAIGDREVPCYQLFWPVLFFLVMGYLLYGGGGKKMLGSANYFEYI